LWPRARLAVIALDFWPDGYVRDPRSGSFPTPSIMKVLILGGYGVFGGRLARLLLQDGIEVVVAGRDEQKAAAFTRHYNELAVSWFTSVPEMASSWRRAEKRLRSVGELQYWRRRCP
jgi:NADP oxidoreductase coenzyme F420-dependent